MNRRITVSIVNWNTREALERCLRALEQHAAELDLHVVVVDNASADGSAEMVGRRFPDVELLARDRNEGFARGNNLGIATAPADYVLILNPDVEVLPGSIPALVRFLERTPDAAAAAPLLVGEDGTIHSHLYRRFPSVAQVLLSWTLLGIVTQRIGWIRRALFEHDLRGSGPVAVDQIPGAAMCIRASALETVGLLDPGYFIWFEDVDWCYRARRAGLRLHVLRDQRMLHEGGVSFRRWTLQTRVFQFYRAFFRFLCRHRLERLLRVALPVLTADLALKEAILRVRRTLGFPPREDVRTLAPTRAAIRDIVRQYRRGRIVDFTSADVPAGVAPADGSTRPPLGAEAADAKAPWSRPDPVEDLPRVESEPVDVVIVNWNGRRYLPACLRALERSTAPVRVIVVDNASTDGSAEYVRSAHPAAEVIGLDENVGYAAGANIGLRVGRSRWAFVMNPDVLLEPDHLRVLRERLESDHGIGAAQGKLYQVTPEDFETVACGVSPQAAAGSRRLDSAGHVIRRSRMVLDRGQGEPDGPEYSAEASVFSACGAALFLRRAMLEDVAPDGAYFDESFFAYKEDIDLGWRARLLGWDVRYVPAAVAHHVRSLPLGGAAWRAMPPGSRRHSWKNHYLLMLKNDRAADLLRALPFVLGWEVVRLGHVLLRDPRVLTSCIDLARSVPGALRARRDLQARRRVVPRELRRWFGRRISAAPPLQAPPSQIRELAR